MEAYTTDYCTVKHRIVKLKLELLRTHIIAILVVIEIMCENFIDIFVDIAHRKK